MDKNLEEKVIWLVRHAQAEHNVGPPGNHRIRDPELTKLV